MQLGALHIKDRCPLMIPNHMVACTKSTLNDHHIKITAEHPVVYANYA